MNNSFKWFAGTIALGALALGAMGDGLQAQDAAQAGLLKEFTWRAIGPANLGGRVDDIEAVESDPAVVYVGMATGGVWKSTNGGTTWIPVFDGQPVQTIGDIAIARSNPNIVWVGTGEANTRQSTTYGRGIYKSTDAGKTWTMMGMPDSGHIGRIVIDPKNPDIVYVAAAGDVFKAHPDRGLYKTVDGGKTWTKSKFIDDDTGFIELAMDPSNSNVLLAASYQRRRTAWGFNGGGPGSALWRSNDAGRTWTKVEGGGLPPYGNWGRVGLDWSRSNPNIIYALIEPGPSAQGPGGGDDNPNAPPDPKRPGLWRSDDKGKTWRLQSNENGRPMYFSQVRVDPRNPDVVFVLERSLARSADGGKTWRILVEHPLMRIQSPQRPSVIPPFEWDVAGAIPPSHPDHHAMWINPANPKQIWLGHDGGVDVSYDGGTSWRFVDWMPVGQFYEVAVDMRQPYYVYGGAQDHGIFGVPSRVRNGAGISNEHVYEIALGDGYHVGVDPTDWATVYASVSGGGGQHIWRYNLKTGEQKYIRPTPPRRPNQAGQQVAVPAAGNIATQLPADEVLRWNWNPGFLISPHNPSVIYFGANRLFKSYNRGDSWIATKDLTKGLDRNTMTIMGVKGSEPMPSKNDGVGQWGTIAAIAESPVMPGVLWVGTDDGNLQVSQDGGSTWTSVADNAAKFPNPVYVEYVEASNFDPATAYVVFDAHHSGDFRPHLYKTTDYGKTWTSLSANLPEHGHLNVVKEDRINRNLLFVGTERGLFVSLDAGKSWAPLMNGLSATIADDVLVHPRDQDLVLATLGRSFYILDDITPLQQLTPDVMAKNEHLFKARPSILWDHDRTAWHGGGADRFRAKNPPDAIFSYYLKGPASSAVRLQVVDAAGTVVRDLEGPREAGIQRVTWDLRKAAPPRPAGQGGGGGGGAPVPGDLITPGDYVIRMTANGRTESAVWRVNEDPNR
jgi:photosystem II stability/assembly factor-like uncharacterized protein